MRTIILKDICGAEVLSRANVRKLYEVVNNDTEILDFSDVTFISRSVADELCNLPEKFPFLEFSGMNEEVEMMHNIVSKGRDVKRVYTSKAKVSVTYNCKTMEDLRNTLLSFGL